MTPADVVRAWKDESYRDSLSEAERAALPENPAGLIEISDQELGLAVGGKLPPNDTLPICTNLCWP